MFSGTYEFAGKAVELHTIYSSVHSYCAGYETERTPDFIVHTSEADFAYERQRELLTAKAEHRTPLEAADSYLEELAVYRKIAEKMPDYDTFLFHGSAIAVDCQAYLFTAKSGTGKSTHTRLWRELFGARAVMVNDDKPLIRAAADSVTVYGTPYNGKHRLGCRMSAPLKAVCILTRAAENTIVPITKQEAYALLLQQVYRPADPVQMKKTLMLIDRLAAQTALYRLGCNMELQAAEVAYNGMKG